MVGSPNEETKETRQCWRVRRAYRPRTWLAGVRASVVAEKRVMTVERRERRKVEVRRTERRKRKPTRVPARAHRWWNQPSAIGLGDTERLTDGLGDEAKSRSLSTEHPPTGKPDAGEPPVRFGGRGSGHVRSPYPYRKSRPAQTIKALRVRGRVRVREQITREGRTEEIPAREVRCKLHAVSPGGGIGERKGRVRTAKSDGVGHVEQRAIWPVTRQRGVQFRLARG